MDIDKYIEPVFRWVVSSGLRVLLILLLTAVALKVSKFLAGKLFLRFREHSRDPEFQKRTDTLNSVIQYVVYVTILIVAGMMVLRELGVEIGPVLAAAGIVGLAVGFGGQHLVQDVISGFFILIEDQIRTGDFVEVAGKSGLVERVNLRMTVLRDVGGNVHFVRNGMIDVVTNKTKEFSRYVFDIGVAYREDVDEVMEVIRQVDEDMRKDPEYRDDILEPMEILGLDQFADSAIVIKARTKTLPNKQWRVGREFNRRLKKVFDERNIEIPFPHVTLYQGQDKSGEAAPLNLRVRAERGAQGGEAQQRKEAHE